ncbi:MAG: response regulator [Lactobacillus sp.]|jgi:two-component system cell cycle sensor histidine kinase/response regulator CckA|nr:response regulator [Lactobacillus sp.]
MLCSLNNNNRPDKLLQKRLILLAYVVVALTISIIAFLTFPDNFMYTTIAILVFSICALYTTIHTISAAEEAISYGGFANEIIKDSKHITRIDNSEQNPILQNSMAKDFFKNENILSYLNKNLSDDRNNKQAIQRLEMAVESLKEETVSISLQITDIEEHFEVSVTPIYLKKTDIFEGPFSIKKIAKDTYLYWNVVNVTAERNINQILEEERKSIHDFIDNFPIGLYIFDKDYNIEYVNHSFAAITGQNREDLLRKNFIELLAKDSPQPERTEKWQGRIFFDSTDDNIKECFAVNENFRYDQNIKTRGAIITGIPGNEEIIQELNLSLDQLSWLFNFAPVSILFVSRMGLIEDINFSAQNIFNISKNGNIFDEISEDDAEKFKKEFIKTFGKKASDKSLEIQLKNGKTAMVYLSPMRKLRTLTSTESEGAVIYMIDATQRRNLELQFAQAQKMQAMGQLAGGVAHDFNNLLTAMIGFCDLLLQRHGVGDPSFADLIQIKQNANRAAGLVRQLLAFSRKQPLKPKLIDVTENFVELSHMLKRILGDQIKLEFYHGNDLGFIKVDPVQFSQVIINLAVNAKDAMGTGGILSIATRIEGLKEPYRFGEDMIKPGEFVVIDVKDNGCGISKENLTRIFEPFFSTKQNVVGSGTGLGLSMVYGIVRQTEGFIKVESEINKGTTFSIYLPRFEKNTEEIINIPAAPKEVIKQKDGSPVITSQKTSSPAVNMSQKPIFGLNVSSIDRSGMENTKGIRILFVEDEDSVRSFAVRALKKKGYEVIECNSAENALEQLEKDLNFNLLITDMVMPGMSGTDLAKIVKDKINDIKIILASGYSEEIARKELRSTDNFEFMAKPFSLGDLTKKVFDVLSDRN